MLNLTMLKHDYLDPNAEQDIPAHFLTVWPGCLTTIRHHEDGFLLRNEIIQKVLRRDNAIGEMNNIRQSGGDTQV